MPRGYWRIIFAVVGVGCFAALLLLSYGLYNASQQHHASYRYQPAGQARLGIPMGSQNPSQPYQPYCQNPETNSDADLCAQWAAVDQVAESNRIASLNTRLTLLTLLVTVLGTGLLVWTFDETRETARRELRAYIRIKPMSVLRQPETRQLVADFQLINDGATPAYDVRHYGRFIAAPLNEAPQSQPISEREVQGDLVPVIVHPNQADAHSFYSSLVVIEDETLSRLKEGALCLFIVGFVRYRDSFGRKHWTQFGYRIDNYDFANPAIGRWMMMPGFGNAT